MKIVLLVSVLMLMACGKDQPCKPNNGTGVLNGQTVTLNDGTCSATETPGTLNQLPVQAITICGVPQGYIYQGVLYNANTADKSSPVGLQQSSDGPYVIPQGNNVQCYYDVTNGKVNNATLPTF